MGLTRFDLVLWILSFVGQIILVAVLVWKKRTRQFPLFTLLMFYESAQDTARFLVFHFGSANEYFWTYWILVLFDTTLQLALVYEISKAVLCPTGKWIGGSRRFFIGLGTVGALMAAALSFAVNPTAPTGLFTWSIRLDLFTSLLIAELVVAMSLSAQRLGLQWRSWVIGLGQGLMIWVSVSLFVDTAQSYWGWAKSGRYVALDHLRIVAFIIALGYWSVVFWRNEPERKPISPEMMKYLYSLQADLAYDVGRVHPKRK